MPEAERGSAVSGSADALVALARQAMGRAHAPYSGFSVGAALEAEDGRTFVGCNVENASYPVTLCAERVALGAAVSQGARRFRRLALCASGPRPASPCGMCRQALAEFGTDLEVVSVAPDGAAAEWTLEALLPESFTLEDHEEREREGASARGEGGA